MDPTLPWYRAAIIRQQVVQMLVAGCALLGIQSEGINWDETVASIFAGVSGAIAVWTFITRLVKPAPNLTQLAADRERELVAEGKAPKRQGGHAATSILLRLAIFAGVIAAAIALAGCGGTVLAYKTAKTLPDQAYVISEHYASVVKQAADIAERPGTPESVKEALQAADRAVKPLILGDDQRDLPGLRDLVETYQAMRDANSEDHLQRAINDAVRKLTLFINAVKSARSQTNAVTVNPGTDRHAWSCLGSGAARTEERRGPVVCVG